MKKLVILAISAAILSGCATRPRSDYEDLNNFKIDCANKGAQMSFLQKQLSTKDERLASLFSLASITRFFSETDAKIADDNTHIRDRSTDAIVRQIMWDIRTQCP